MKKNQDTFSYEDKMSREQWVLHEQWRERRDERDNQTIIMLKNLAYWTAFTVCADGAK